MFFRARDPDALAHWYTEHLGIDPVPATYDEQPWWQEQGPTVFSPFPAYTEYFGRPDQAWKLNFRVRDLDAMITQLRRAGIEVTPDPTALSEWAVRQHGRPRRQPDRAVGADSSRAAGAS